MAHPKLVITAEGQDFDANTLQKWRDEGFDVSYLAYDGTRIDYINALQHLAEPLGLGETYAIVGQPAQRVRFDFSGVRSVC